MTLHDPSHDDSWFQRTFVRVVLWITTLPAWLRPVALGALLLFLMTAVRGVFVLFFHPEPKALLAFLVALVVASAGGALAGFAFLVIRTPLKHLGVVGDLLTGITVSCVYLFGILIPAKYWFGDDSLETRSDWVVAAVIAGFFGVVVTVVYWVNVRKLKKS